MTETPEHRRDRHKLFARPIVAPFFLIFGITLSQFGYGYLQPGSFQYTQQSGATQIISPTSSPTLYWTVSIGILALAGVCLVLAAYGALCLVRAYRAKSALQFQAPLFGIFMFGLGLIVMILALVAGTCSHR
jgi:hypothetical protein